jgi:iron complex outermembrane receptor protein
MKGRPLAVCRAALLAALVLVPRNTLRADGEAGAAAAGTGTESRPPEDGGPSRPESPAGTGAQAGVEGRLPEDDEVYRLPETELRAERDSPEYVGREEMDRDHARDLQEALRYVPGVILSGGGRRNDSNFTIRGFGVDSVPVFVDGIAMGSPYRGEGDSARFLTGDLESVEVQKGFSSLLLGANTMGGAVLMRTAKPKKELEASAGTNLELDNAGRYASSTHVLDLGLKLPLFYAKLVLQHRGVDHYRLPEGFEPQAGNPQAGGDRLWSGSGDTKLTFLAGVTPVEALDLWVTFVYQDADKGLSPPETVTRDFSIWDWPEWKRQSVSLNGVFSAGAFSAEGLFYFDKYDNRLDEYYNMKAFELGIHAPHSDYDEYSLGGRLTGKWEINGWNSLQAAVTWKKEDHRSLRGTIGDEETLTEEMHVNEDTWSLGLEYSMNPWRPLTLKAGGGFDALIPLEYRNGENEFLKLLEADYFIVKTRLMFLYTWQFGVFYRLPFGEPEARNHELRLTYARKNHFPTMARRYSTRFGSTLPNPKLGPETANHFEFGYRGSFGGVLSLNAALYYSVITNKIVDIQLGNPHYPSALVDYSRNLDSTAFWGFELGTELALKNYLSGGLSFSVNRYLIRHSQSGVKEIPCYPAVTANMYLVIRPLRIVSIIPRLEYIGPRFADTLGEEELEGFLLGSIRVQAELAGRLVLSAGVENILDTLYEIRRHYPMAGRSYTFGLTVRY